MDRDCTLKAGIFVCMHCRVLVNDRGSSGKMLCEIDIVVQICTYPAYYLIVRVHLTPDTMGLWVFDLWVGC